jgi:hypothetical protein
MKMQWRDYKQIIENEPKKMAWSSGSWSQNQEKAPQNGV